MQRLLSIALSCLFAVTLSAQEPSITYPCENSFFNGLFPELGYIGPGSHKSLMEDTNDGGVVIDGYY